MHSNMTVRRQYANCVLPGVLFLKFARLFKHKLNHELIIYEVQ